MLDVEYIGYRLLERGFKTFFLYMFNVVEGRKFIIEPLHEKLFKYFQDIYDGKVTRCNINIAPRSAKTTLAIWFVVYTLTKNPKSQIIYTSYSQSLLGEISSKVASILENEVYKNLFPHNNTMVEDKELNPINDFWRDYLYKDTAKNTYSAKVIKTYAGGICLFASIGSQITGYGCFAYDTLVLTEKGYLKLGDIVENKIDVKILSYNFEKQKQEYQKIYKYIKNDISDYMQLTLDNGEVIDCTPDHIFYLENGQEIEAQFLQLGDSLMSNSFNLGQANTDFLHNFFTRIIFIKDKINLFFSEFISKIIFKSSFVSLITKAISYFRPNNTTFNIRNRRSSDIIVFCYLFISSFIFGNSNSHFFIKFLEFVIALILVLHIFKSSTVTKIFKSIISWIRIKMSNLLIRCTDKCKQNQTMYIKSFPLVVFIVNAYSLVTFSIGMLLKNFVSSSTKYYTIFTNKITSKIRNRKVINIVYSNHKTSSYCLTLWNNNNFYITKSQVLVHNCSIRGAKGFTGFLCLDDANKPADIHSAIMRSKVVRFYEETLLSRLNNPDCPILNIQQRLHIEDLSGVLQDKYNFQTLKVPLLDENGNCNLPSQYTEERIKELQINNYMFQSQYMQEPISATGEVINPEWFGYYPLDVNFDYDKIVIAGDTAINVKEANDYTCFLVGGVTPNNQLHILDIVHGKWEYPALKQTLINLYNKWQRDKRVASASAVYIENKASGQQLIQDFKKTGLPIVPIEVTKDKLARVEEVLEFIATGNVLLPVSDGYGNNRELLNECQAFTRDNTHIHDDMVDTLTYLINNTIAKREISILDVL